MNVKLHIEELVLHGLDAVDPVQVGAAVERQLARLVTENGLPPVLERGRAATALDGGSFDVPSNQDASSVGERIAQAVYRGAGR